MVAEKTCTRVTRKMDDRPMSLRDGVCPGLSPPRLFSLQRPAISGANTVERSLLELIGEFEKGFCQVRVSGGLGEPPAIGGLFPKVQ